MLKTARENLGFSIETVDAKTVAARLRYPLSRTTFGYTFSVSHDPHREGNYWLCLKCLTSTPVLECRARKMHDRKPFSISHTVRCIHPEKEELQIGVPNSIAHLVFVFGKATAVVEKTPFRDHDEMLRVRDAYFQEGARRRLHPQNLTRFHVEHPNRPGYYRVYKPGGLLLGTFEARFS